MSKDACKALLILYFTRSDVYGQERSVSQSVNSGRLFLTVVELEWNHNEYKSRHDTFQFTLTKPTRRQTAELIQFPYSVQKPDR